jgi:hypothetical protein
MKARSVLAFLALLITALSLGPSFAHVLEAPPRLYDWPAELWREATVFHGQYRFFAFVGGPLDAAAIIASGAFAFALRKDRDAFPYALAGTVLFALSLAVWVAWVAPANAVLASWVPGPVPGDFVAVRNRWESGHMAITAIKLLGFMAIALAAIGHRRDDERA